MVSHNRVILTGKVTKSAERRFRPDGSAVIQFSLELNQEEAFSREKGRSFIHIVALGELAEREPDLFQSGQYVQVEGTLKQRRWQTPEGRSRTRIEVIATHLRRVEARNRTIDSIARGGDDEQTG